MKCPNCNLEMKKNYCLRCGIMINNGEIVLLGKKEEKNDLEKYIGDNYYKISKKNNFSAAFFGPLYLIYRKLYLLGFILGYIELYTLILISYVDFRIILILKIISSLFYYTCTNSIYLYIIKRKKIIKNKKSTSIVAVFLAMFLYLISLLIYFKYI